MHTLYPTLIPQVVFEDIPGSPNKFKVTTNPPQACPSGCTGELNGLTFTMTSGFKLSGVLSDDYRSITWSNAVVWTRQLECDGTATITLQGPSGGCACAGMGGVLGWWVCWDAVDGEGVISRFRLINVAWLVSRMSICALHKLCTRNSKIKL